jgi:type II secretory ATPase GspE/PulE/Tfp pilus assembly ATPase PilB-like protein
VGCAACQQTGYTGHRMIAELLPVTEELAEALREDQPARELRRLAFTAGARHLAYDGVRKAAQGLVALADVRAAVGEDEFLA